MWWLPKPSALLISGARAVALTAAVVFVAVAVNATLMTAAVVFEFGELIFISNVEVVVDKSVFGDL